MRHERHKTNPGKRMEMEHKNRHERSWEQYLLQVGYPNEEYDLYVDYHMWPNGEVTRHVDYAHLIDYIVDEWHEWYTYLT